MAEEKITILTAVEFIAHLHGGGDFRHLGEYAVAEEIHLPKEDFLRHVFLGQGTFEGDFYFGAAKFKGVFNCNEATFKRGVMFETAEFESFGCDKVMFMRNVFFFDSVFNNVFSCGDAQFLGAVSFHTATFRKSFDFGSALCSGAVHCGCARFIGRGLFFDDATFADTFSCGNATFSQINCGTATLSEGFFCEGATFTGPVDAMKNPALGMVIYHYKTGNVHFPLNYFQKN